MLRAHWQPFDLKRLPYVYVMSPAGRVALLTNLKHTELRHRVSTYHVSAGVGDLLGDALLGQQDIAVLLQSGLISVMNGSMVVQLNQKMMIDLLARASWMEALRRGMWA